MYNGLLKNFEDLPKAKRNSTYDDYAVVNVSPSVVPNPYLPSFRIFAYNTTGTPYVPALHANQTSCYETAGQCDVAEQWYASPDSPSRTNRLWTPLGYAQVGQVVRLSTVAEHRLRQIRTVLSAGSGQREQETRAQGEARIRDVCAHGAAPAAWQRARGVPDTAAPPSEDTPECDVGGQGGQVRAVWLGGPDGRGVGGLGAAIGGGDGGEVAQAVPEVHVHGRRGIVVGYIMEALARNNKDGLRDGGGALFEDQGDGPGEAPREWLKRRRMGVALTTDDCLRISR